MLAKSPIEDTSGSPIHLQWSSSTRSSIRHNRKTSFVAHVGDASGETRIFFHDKAAETFFPMLQVGHSYLISSGKVHLRRLWADRFDITFDGDALCLDSIRPCLSCAPIRRYNHTPVKDIIAPRTTDSVARALEHSDARAQVRACLEQKEINQMLADLEAVKVRHDNVKVGMLIDLVMIIRDVQPVTTRKSSHSTFTTRDVTLFDKSCLQVVVLQLSGSLLNSVTDGDVGRVVGVKSALVDTVCLVVCEVTFIEIQPDCPHTAQLQSWVFGELLQAVVGPPSIKLQAEEIIKMINMQELQLKLKSDDPSLWHALESIFLSSNKGRTIPDMSTVAAVWCGKRNVGEVENEQSRFRTKLFSRKDVGATVIIQDGQVKVNGVEKGIEGEVKHRNCTGQLVSFKAGKVVLNTGACFENPEICRLALSKTALAVEANVETLHSKEWMQALAGQAEAQYMVCCVCLGFISEHDFG